MRCVFERSTPIILAQEHRLGARSQVLQAGAQLDRAGWKATWSLATAGVGGGASAGVVSLATNYMGVEWLRGFSREVAPPRARGPGAPHAGRGAHGRVLDLQGDQCACLLRAHERDSEGHFSPLTGARSALGCGR